MKVTCTEHRQSLLLLSLKRRLEDETLPPEERRRLEREIAGLESELEMD